VFDPYLDHGNRSYMPMPFGIVVPADGSAGWGFYIRTSRRTWFDVGATDPDRLAIEVALDPRDRRPTVELAIYVGGPADVLSAFLDEVGRPAPPPDWVFRPWMSGNEWNTQARVRAEVERSLAEAIPVGVVVVEAWSDENTFVAFGDARYAVHPDGSPHTLADFSFPAEGAWPDPKGLLDWLHERGIRVLLWQVPVLPPHPTPGSQAAADEQLMIERGYAVRRADGRPYRVEAEWFRNGLVLDPTNDAALDWWLAKRRYLVAELGVDGFKTDGGEHVRGDALSYADGTRGGATNNRYPVLYEAAFHRLLRDCGRDPVTFSRSGFAGSQRFPCHWAGDERSSWEAFRASITAGLSAGASGISFWGWDLAGFSGEVPSAELYLRAAAMACFCPIMQYHSEFNGHRLPPRDRTPWNVAERTGDGRVMPIYRGFATLRENLVPYLVEQAGLACERGLPLMRALPLEWPDDKNAWAFPYEYLLGDDLLIAPVVEPGVRSWPVYLPPGAWVELWGGDHIEGSQVVDRQVPIDLIPVFSRAMRRPRSEALARFRAFAMSAPWTPSTDDADGNHADN
jgi:alpha-glucosidase (family GH31 glycosyl hydrolase)